MTTDRNQHEIDRASFYVDRNNVHIEIVHEHTPTNITATWTDVGQESACEYSTDSSVLVVYARSFVQTADVGVTLSWVEFE